MQYAELAASKNVATAKEGDEAMDNTAYRETTDRQDKGAQATEADVLKSTTEQPPVGDVEFGSGWYHDVAIKESEQPVSRKH